MPPERYRVLLTETAFEDLKRIRDHIARTAPDTAADVARKILAECYRLDTLPHKGERRRSRKISGEVRQLPVLRSFRMLFSVSDEQGTVTIHRVQHGSRNQWR